MKLLNVSSAIILLIGMASSGAIAQDAQQTSAATQPPLGTVEHGNPPPVVQGDTTTVQHGNAMIIFEPAGATNLDSAKFAQWQQFAAEHPGIARAIEYRPRVVNDPGFLRKHPALEDFYQAHPDVRDALIADPGNFEAIPPRPGE